MLSDRASGQSVYQKETSIGCPDIAERALPKTWSWFRNWRKIAKEGRLHARITSNQLGEESLEEGWQSENHPSPRREGQQMLP
jgi:hypothetical protein